MVTNVGAQVLARCERNKPSRFRVLARELRIRLHLVSNLDIGLADTFAFAAGVDVCLHRSGDVGREARGHQIGEKNGGFIVIQGHTP